MGTDIEIIHAFGVVVPKAYLDKLIAAWLDANFGDAIRKRKAQVSCEQNQRALMLRFLNKEAATDSSEGSKLPCATMIVDDEAKDEAVSDEEEDDAKDDVADGMESEDDPDPELTAWLAGLESPDYADWNSDLRERDPDLFESCSRDAGLRIAEHSSYNGREKSDCYFVYWGTNKTYIGGYKVGGSTMGLCDPHEWPMASGLIGGACIPSALATDRLDESRINCHATFKNIVCALHAHRHPVLAFLANELIANKTLRAQFSKWMFWYLC